jgi:beta-glucosidase
MVFGTTENEPTKLELKNRELAREAATQGFVLLKNDGILPFKDKRIALYGSGARMTVKGGTGSGAVRERYSVTVEEGLKAAGYEITTESWLNRFDAFYKDSYKAYEAEVEDKVKGIKDFYQILHLAGKFTHPTGIPVTDEDVLESKVDTAIYVLARQAGEGSDREDVRGDYKLDDVEINNLRFVSEEYKHLVVIVNVGGVIDLSFMDELHVSAMVYYVQGGEEGGNALADVLSGKKNFSGKLATSWAYQFSDIPSNSTYSYLGGDPYNQEYNEGIYVGYRFYDTFSVKPRYHFGYGLSYTSFAIITQSAVLLDENVTVKISVKNTGEYTGREVIQVYGTVPFGLGAEYQRLVAFEKTKELEPGEEQILEITFSLRDLTIYNEVQASYILQKGNYILRVGNASNHNEPSVMLTLEEDVVSEVCTNICEVKHKVVEVVPPERESEVIGDIIHIQINPSCIKKIIHKYPKATVYEDESLGKIIESLTIEELATLVCGGGTKGKRIVNALGASGSTTAELYEKHGIPNVILADGPAGLNLTSQIVKLPDGSVRAAKVEANLEAYKRYLFGFAKIALGSQMADVSDGTVYYQYATAWPCSQLLAQTFNTELMEQVGDAVGREMEEFGVTVWLAPGMNIHRNPLCGRTFEYYSEDPLVSGKMAAAIVRGVQTHPGKGMSIKHFVANNCELERNSSSSNVNERALREIYLKGFEIAVKESTPMTVMASYNMINSVYATNNYDLLVKVLRNEWGFDGLVMSDWDSMKADRDDCMKPVTGDVLKAAAAQCDLVMPGREDQINALVQGMKTGVVDMENVKRSAGRVLAMVKKNTVCSYR